ncbi:MAG: DUF1835 domain-containing protein [Bacteroidia bacterium]
MKITEVHVLNGDALRKQLPQTVEGKRIVFRESLIEGPLKVELNDDFFEERANFLSASYEISKEEYFERSKAELDKIKQVKRDAHVNLWFEHDAFCQVNLWFACKVLHEKKFTGKAFLVLPNKQDDLWIGFGSHSEEALNKAYYNRILLSPFELKELAKCWEPYALSFFRRLITQVKKSMHILPYSEDVARSIAELKMKNLIFNFIKKALENDPKVSFSSVFKSFWDEYGMLGLGDGILKNEYDKQKAFI